MMEKYTGPERRKYPRLNTNFVVSYRLKQIPDSYDISQSKNVSQEGMLLTTNRYFDKGTLLAMIIRFPFFAGKIEATGEVVESKEVVKNLLYETRIKFLDLEKDFFESLGKFIAERLK